jgi:predicted HTH transcriptional regulator
MLYIKPINDITWDDVETFCLQKIPENAYLDYKRDFPTHLEKIIAAMANTLGGIILIGVAEDKENKPIVPVKGVDFKKGLSERVMNIILTNITPPVFPEIAVPCNKRGDKALLVVRIPQSHQTPHAIAENTEVYIRTGNRNKPERIASINEIEWLRDHRKKIRRLKRISL